MKNIEVELRSLIDKSKYDELLAFFSKEGKLLSSDNQVTYTMNDRNSIRIQRNDFGAKLWIKLGEHQHDATHEEIEVKFERNDFDEMEKAMAVMGFEPKMKWFRNRQTFDWDGISAMVDYTKGYGHILELEKLCEKGEEKATLETLKERMASLGIAVTPKEEFDRKFADYKENWKKLTGSE
jgi:adenylate cyclase class IV